MHLRDGDDHWEDAPHFISRDIRFIHSFNKIGSNTSLRYTCQLLTPAKVIAMANGKEQVLYFLGLFLIKVYGSLIIGRCGRYY